ncbi:hypothetical protein ElyMa_002573200 [Elysia marginata]|uniref:Uncharacterized protein n=1 Tax=Elysia marginata TaxID=1093978 RepID=A0AAV4H0E2_9GAST|nr:hypothetical protein ElyMa_002573200 [Elysia marginata]
MKKRRYNGYKEIQNAIDPNTDASIDPDTAPPRPPEDEARKASLPPTLLSVGQGASSMLSSSQIQPRSLASDRVGQHREYPDPSKPSSPVPSATVSSGANSSHLSQASTKPPIPQPGHYGTFDDGQQKKKPNLKGHRVVTFEISDEHEEQNMHRKNHSRRYRSRLTRKSSNSEFGEEKDTRIRIDDACLLSKEEVDHMCDDTSEFVRYRPNASHWQQILCATILLNPICGTAAAVFAYKYFKKGKSTSSRRTLRLKSIFSLGHKIDTMNPYGYQGHRYAHQNHQVQTKHFVPHDRYECRTWEPPAGEGVFLFIKFPIYEAEFAAQSVVLGKRSVTPRGRFVGMARKIHDISSYPHVAEALVVYLFESTEAATRFFVGDRRFKQPDFPPPSGACEAWTVVKSLPTQDEDHYTTYMMCENQLRGATYNAFKYEFARPFADIVLEYGGQPFVVQSVGCESLRRHHVDRNTIESVHIFRDEYDIKRMMNDPRFAELKRRQMAMATDLTSVFTITPQACP